MCSVIFTRKSMGFYVINLIFLRILNVVLNYFTLTTYFWMLCEGTYLQLLLVNTFQVRITFFQYALKSLILTTVKVWQVEAIFKHINSSRWILTKCIVEF